MDVNDERGGQHGEKWQWSKDIKIVRQRADTQTNVREYSQHYNVAIRKIRIKILQCKGIIPFI